MKKIFLSIVMGLASLGMSSAAELDLMPMYSPDLC